MIIQGTPRPGFNPLARLTAGTNKPPNTGQEAEHGATAGSASASGEKLTDEQIKQLRELQSSDREVRAHEAAHMAAAGGLATGGASFTYQKGPDGGRYAVGGEVNIDTSPVANDPEATIRKAETIRRAAMAPADPSSQDRQVAAAAMQMQTRALSELGQHQSKQRQQGARMYFDTASDEREPPVFSVRA